MTNEDRMRDEGGHESGTGSDRDGNTNRPDPRRTREQEEERKSGRNDPKYPNTQRPDQSPKTA